MLWDDDNDVVWSHPPIAGGVQKNAPRPGENEDDEDLDAEARKELLRLEDDDLSPGPPRLLLTDRNNKHNCLMQAARLRGRHVDAAAGTDATAMPAPVDDDIDDLGDDGGSGGAFIDTGKEFLASKAFLGAIYPPSVYIRPGKDVFDNMDETFNNWSEPEISLELDYVMGYRARDSRYNIHWISEKEVVFPVAAVGVIYNMEIKDEDFFFEHTDDIVSLDLHRADPTKPGDVDLVASGSIGARRTCQLCIWEARAPRALRHNITGFMEFGVVAVNFNPDASMVCAVGLDEHHTVALFSVATGLLMAHCAADKNRVLHARFNLSSVVNSNENFVTVGVSHICFWGPEGTAGKHSNYFLTTSEPVDRRLSWKRGFGIDDIDNIALMALDFTHAHVVVGGTDGIIYLMDSVKHCVTARVAVDADRCSKIYSILTFRGPEDDVSTEHQTLAVGTQQGFISFWDVHTSPDNLDVRIGESHKITSDGSRINLNLCDAATNNDNDHLVNSVRSMAWYEPKGWLAVGTILTAVYSINVKKWSASLSQSLRPSGNAAETISELAKVSRVLIAGHYGNLKDANAHGEIWGIDAHPSEQKVVTCGDDATVRLWDLDTAKQVATANVKYMAHMVSMHPNGKLVAVGHRNGGVTILSGDLKSVVVPFQRHDRKKCICDLSFSPNGKYLAIAWGKVIDIYALNHTRDEVSGHTTIALEFVGQCKGHTSYVAGLDWNLESTLIQTLSRGYDLLYHSIPDCVMVTGAKCIADELWYTQSCTIGWGVQGIWPRYADGTDVNSVAKSRSQRWLATTDDWGRVKLFNYPCLGSGFDRKTGRLNSRPSCKEYRGHSSHVTNSSWTFDDSYLVTTGGADLSVFVWKVVYNDVKKPEFFLNPSVVGFVQHGKKGLSKRADELDDDGMKGERSTSPPELGGSRPGTGVSTVFSGTHVARVANQCFMCKYEFTNQEAVFCPRCNAARTEVSKGKWRKAWTGEADSRFMRPTESFAHYTTEQQKLRKTNEERVKPEVMWKAGNVKMVEVVQGASSDEEEIERKLRAMKKTLKKTDPSTTGVGGVGGGSTTSVAKSVGKTKKTAGPDFRDY